MAAASVRIESKNGVIRHYGGNRSDVRALRNRYQNLTLEQFLELHPIRREEDFKTLKISWHFNKR